MPGNRTINANPNVYAMMDMSGGMQNATSHLVRKRIEVFDVKNGEFHSKIGSIKRRDGYEQVGQTIQFGNAGLYGGVYLFNQNNRIIVGINNSNNTATTLQYLDSDNYWKTIFQNTFPNASFSCLNYLDELYVAGGDNAGNYDTLRNIDSTLTASTTRNVLNAPKCKFIAEYAGQLYAINCQVSGTTYKDRVYVSSAPIGVITHIQGDQIGNQVGIRVDSVRYLKVGMSIDIYKAGTSTPRIQNLTITSVDKVNSRIGFVGQNISINNLDEVWLSGRYGLLTTFWNTDWPTPQSADWFRLPPGEDENNSITGFTVNNNRLFLFTKNSMWKWDGNNLVRLSPVIGCIANKTIQNIAAWTIWLHSTGVWGYNDNTGQMKLLSRAITPTILRINPAAYQYCNAVVVNRRYKLVLGHLQDAVLATTSTSTSSTSTSSTSSSTSSTSTSSTSTSSTVSTTTSTSSTSSSTSSTSVSSTSSSSTSSSTSVSTSSTSSTSTSLSTSTSSTTTTTQPTGKDIRRMVYDFDLNTWGQESHTREIRAQFIHEMNGLRKPYFVDENGYLFRDETSFTDFGQSIPLSVEIGRTNCGTETSKTFLSIQVDSENARAGIIQYQLDGNDWLTLGQIKDQIQTLPFPQGISATIARDINFRFVHNDFGDPPIFNGLTVYFIITENLPNELGQRL